MGFWDAVKSVGRTVGRKMSDWGDRHGGWIGETVGKAGRALQDVCRETSRNTGETGSYDPDSSSASDAKQVADILSGFSLGLKNQAQVLEQQSKQIINEYFDILASTLTELLGNSMVASNVKMQKEIAIQGIDHQLLTVLSQRVSLSDPECLQILKMPRGAQKEAAMDAFGRKVINEGLDKLCCRLQIGFKVINESLSEELDDFIQQQTNAQERLIQKLKQMADKFESDADDKEIMIISPAQKLAACDLVDELLQERKSA